jgi:hypothetical protein
VTWHYTEGSYSQTFSSYQYCIPYNPHTGKAWVVVSLPCDMLGQHVWHRNTGNLGISLCGSTSRPYKIAPIQVEVCARLTAEICFVRRLPLSCIHDHRYWADRDDYGPSSSSRDVRTDVGTAWYWRQLRLGKLHVSLL